MIAVFLDMHDSFPTLTPLSLVRYEYEPLMTVALELLLKYYTKRQHFIHTVQKVQLLADVGREALYEKVCL